MQLMEAICSPCVSVVEWYNSLCGELSNNTLQALPVIRGSCTISTVHPVPVTPGPSIRFRAASPPDSSGSALIVAGAGSPALTDKFFFHYNYYRNSVITHLAIIDCNSRIKSCKVTPTRQQISRPPILKNYLSFPISVHRMFVLGKQWSEQYHAS